MMDMVKSTAKNIYTYMGAYIYYVFSDLKVENTQKAQAVARLKSLRNPFSSGDINPSSLSLVIVKVEFSKGIGFTGPGIKKAMEKLHEEKQLAFDP